MIETKLLFRNCLTGKRILKYLLSFSRHNEDLIPRVSIRIYPYPIALRIYYQSVHTIGHLPGSSSQQRRANFWCLDQASVVLAIKLPISKGGPIKDMITPKNICLDF